MDFTESDVTRLIRLYGGQGYQCSQVVLHVAQDLLGGRNPSVMRAMRGFGEGIGGAGSLCGAIAGGTAALSLAENCDDAELFPRCAELHRRFTGEIEQSALCSDITGIDFTDPDQAEWYHESPGKVARCERLMTKTVMLVYELARGGRDASEAIARPAVAQNDTCGESRQTIPPAWRAALPYLKGW